MNNKAGNRECKFPSDIQINKGKQALGIHAFFYKKNIFYKKVNDEI